jgi:hypothetical protein
MLLFLLLWLNSAPVLGTRTAIRAGLTERYIWTRHDFVIARGLNGTLLAL